MSCFTRFAIAATVQDSKHTTSTTTHDILTSIRRLLSYRELCLVADTTNSDQLGQRTAAIPADSCEVCECLHAEVVYLFLRALQLLAGNHRSLGDLKSPITTRACRATNLHQLRKHGQIFTLCCTHVYQPAIQTYSGCPAEPTRVLSLDGMSEKRKTLTIGMLWLLHGHTLKQLEYLKTAAYVVATAASLTRQHNCLIP